MFGKNACLKERDNDVVIYEKYNNEYSKEKKIHTFPDGLIDDYTYFKNGNVLYVFGCYFYPDGDILKRQVVYESNYNDYIYKLWNEK